MLACVAALSLVAVGSPAQAGAVELEWQAPAGCTKQGGFEQRVEGFLGGRLAESAGEPVRARVHVEASDAGYAARLDLQTAAGSQERRLADPDCDVLADASAFIVAVAIDPDTAVRMLSAEPAATPEGEPRPPEPETSEAPEPRPEESAPPQSVPTQDRRRSRGVRGAARLAATGSSGVLPGFAPGTQLAAAVLIRRARVEAKGQWHFERGVAVGERGTASLTLWELGLGGCFEPGRRKLEVPLCGGLSAGAMRAQSRGLTENGSATIAWISADVTGGLAYVPARWVALRADVAARIPLNRPAFTVENIGEVHRSWPVAVSGALAVEARFP